MLPPQRTRRASAPRRRLLMLCRNGNDSAGSNITVARRETMKMVDIMLQHFIDSFHFQAEHAHSCMLI